MLYIATSDFSIHMRGLWTQLILITVVWSFAFVSLKMHDTILKYLYALMNCLQVSILVKKQHINKRNVLLLYYRGRSNYPERG